MPWPEVAKFGGELARDLNVINFRNGGTDGRHVTVNGDVTSFIDVIKWDQIKDAIFH